MFYIGLNGEIMDDGQGDGVAYALGPWGERRELLPEDAQRLTEQWRMQQKSRLPVGDWVARATSAVGIAPCSPCKRRQMALNELGDRLLGFLHR